MLKPDNSIKKISKSLKENLDINMSGDLTVEKITEKKESDVLNIPLLKVGDVFMKDGHEYKVCFVNVGQRRFTCKPYKGNY